jgi:Fe-S oxidoreductase
MNDQIETLQERREFIGRCVRCSQCKFVPTPKSHAFASACPSMDWGGFHSFSASGQLIAGYALMEGKADATDETLKSIYSCTMCGACDTSCKVNLGETVEPLDSLHALRAYLVDKGHSPSSHKTIVKNLVEQGNKAGIPRSERDQWARGLKLNPKTDGCDGVLLHIGDELSYRNQNWNTLRTIVQTIAATGVPLVYGGTREGSSGSLAHDLGYVGEARAMAGELLQLIRESGAGSVVTFSAEALSAFRSLYPRFGLSFEGIRILHISEYLEELCEMNRIGIAPVRSGRAAYHDPCKLGRLSEPWRRHEQSLASELSYYVSRDRAALRFGNDGCYTAPRALMRRLGFELVELERSRISSYCCGAGGGVLEENSEAAHNAARSRLDEIASADVTLCVTSCPGCKSHLEAAEQSATDALEISDLLDLIAEGISVKSLERPPSAPRGDSERKSDPSPRKSGMR